MEILVHVSLSQEHLSYLFTMYHMQVQMLQQSYT